MGGEDHALSKVFKAVGQSSSEGVTSRRLRWLRKFVAFQPLHADGDPLQFITEDFGHATLRIEEAIEAAGMAVDHASNDFLYGTTWVTRGKGETRSISYLAEYLHVIRMLYRLLSRHKLRGPASPADIDGFHTMKPKERLKLARQLFPDNKHSWKHVGGRYLVRQKPASPPAVEDPEGCAERMHDALEKADVCQAVKDINLIARVNGSRISAGAKASALGLARCGFGDEFKARNKFDSGDLDLRLTLPPDVRARIFARLEATPHPGDAARTLLDHIKELWVAGDHAALAQIPLIVSPKTGRPYTYGGLHYHLFDAWHGKVLVHSETGGRSVTSQWNRHASITSDVDALMARTTDKDERGDGIERIARSHGQKTDQTRRYAAIAYKREEEARRREDVLARASRSKNYKGVPALEPGQPRPELSDAVAQAEWESMP